MAKVISKSTPAFYSPMAIVNKKVPEFWCPVKGRVSMPKEPVILPSLLTNQARFEFDDNDGMLEYCTLNDLEPTIQMPFDPFRDSRAMLDFVDLTAYGVCDLDDNLSVVDGKDGREEKLVRNIEKIDIKTTEEPLSKTAQTFQVKAEDPCSVYQFDQKVDVENGVRLDGSDVLSIDNKEYTKKALKQDDDFDYFVLDPETGIAHPVTARYQVKQK